MNGGRRRGVAVAGLIMLAGLAQAGRPMTIDDADPVEPGHVEVEAGAAFEHDEDCQHWDFPFGVTLGLRPDLEAGLGFGGQLERRTVVHHAHGGRDYDHEGGLGDLAFGAKWRFLPTCPLGARHALAPSVKLPTADEDKDLGSGETDYDLAWLASRPLGERTGLHFNLGYSWIGGPDDDVLHYGVALDCQLVERLQWVGEVFAEKELTRGTSTIVQYQAGFRWTPADGVTLDLAGGSKISGDAPDAIATAGLTWTFGPALPAN